MSLLLVMLTYGTLRNAIESCKIAYYNNDNMRDMTYYVPAAIKFKR